MGLLGPSASPNIKKSDPANVSLIFPVAVRGLEYCARTRFRADEPSVAAETIFAKAKWKKIQLAARHQGPSERPLRCPADWHPTDGPPQRILDKGQQHLPGEEAWLVGEWRSSGERKYYLSSLPANANLKRLAAALKARWVCEQAHQQMKEELGLDHFEGRSWQGLHRHAALMTMIAYAFLQHQRLEQAKRENFYSSRAAATDPASCPTRRHQRALAKANL